MFIGVYLCSSIFILCLTLLIVTAVGRSETPWHKRNYAWSRFILTAASSIFACLVLFIALSALTELLPVASAGSYNIPQDFLAYVIFGWFILAIGLTGIFSPIFAAFWLHRQHQS